MLQGSNEITNITKFYGEVNTISMYKIVFIINLRDLKNVKERLDVKQEQNSCHRG